MDSALANAIRLLQTGALREAEAACRALLARNSSNAHAMQVLGVALRQLGRLDEAETNLRHGVELAPGNIEFRTNLAQLLGARDKLEASRSGNTALAEQLLLGLVTEVGNRPELLSCLGTIFQESGRYAEAMAVARHAAEAQPENVAAAENFVAASLSAGQPDAALPTIERFRSLTPDDQRWITYRADVARQTGERWFDEWCNPERVVRVYEVSAPQGYASMEAFHSALQPALEARHRQRSHPLDQSLRNGTQTSRGLLADDDPIIRALLGAMAEPIASYQAEMSCDPAHPLYARNLAPARMVGCWSIRLRRGGFHVNHIHPQGWISSAYYISVPSEVEDISTRNGWIKFGEPRFPMPDGEAGRFVQPRPGRLVLFPSYLWHGTTPILGDEPRLAIAFDAVPRHRAPDA